METLESIRLTDVRRPNVPNLYYSLYSLAMHIFHKPALCLPPLSLLHESFTDSYRKHIASATNLKRDIILHPMHWFFIFSLFNMCTTSPNPVMKKHLKTGKVPSSLGSSVQLQQQPDLLAALVLPSGK